MNQLLSHENDLFFINGMTFSSLLGHYVSMRVHRRGSAFYDKLYKFLRNSKINIIAFLLVTKLV